MTDARASRPPPGPPPTIGYLRDQGVRWIHVSCTAPNCLHGADLKLEVLGLPDDTPFPAVATPAALGLRALRMSEGARHAAVAGEVA